MLRPILVLALIASALGLTNPLEAHGGVFLPPLDTSLPPPGTLPGGTGPAMPAIPTAPGPATPTTPLVGGAAMGVTRGGAMLGPDLTGWEIWWQYNRDRYLRIPKRHAGDWAITPGGSAESESPADTISLGRARARTTVVPVIEGMLDERRPTTDVSSAGLMALARASMHPEQVDRLSSYLSARNQEIAETAVLSLGMLRTPHLIGRLDALMRGQASAAKQIKRKVVPWRTREFAAYALALLAEQAPLESMRRQIAESLLDVAAEGKSSTSSFEAACLIALAQVPLNNPEPELLRLRQLLGNTRIHDLVRAHVPAAAARLMRSAETLDPRLAREWRNDWLVRLSDRNEPYLIRHACIQALAWAPLDLEDEEDVVRNLIRAAREDADKLIRHQALLSLGLIASRDGGTAQTLIMPTLLRKLDDGQQQERGWSALALGVMSYEAREAGLEVPNLIASRVRQRLSEEKTPSVRSACAIALGLMRDDKATPVLRGVLRDQRNPELQGYVALSLGMLRAGDALDDLRSLLKRSKRKPTLLRSVAESLALLQDPEALQDLIDLIGRGNQRVLATTAAVAQALGAMRDERAWDPLIELAKDKSQSSLARAFAAAALGRISDEDEVSLRGRFSRCLNYRVAPITMVDPAGATGLLNLL